MPMTKDEMIEQATALAALGGPGAETWRNLAKSLSAPNPIAAALGLPGMPPAPAAPAQVTLPRPAPASTPASVARTIHEPKGWYALIPQPRLTALPPDDALKPYPELLMTARRHRTAINTFFHAYDAVADAHGGRAWAAAVAADTQARRGAPTADHGASAVATLIAGEGERVAEAVAAAAEADATLAELYALAGSPGIREAVEARLDQWVEGACDLVRQAVAEHSAVPLVRLEDQQIHSYPPLRRMYQWTAMPTQNYNRPGVGRGVDRRLGLVIVEHEAAITSLLGGRGNGMFSQIAMLEYLPDGPVDPTPPTLPAGQVEGTIVTDAPRRHRRLLGIGPR